MALLEEIGRGGVSSWRSSAQDNDARQVGRRKHSAALTRVLERFKDLDPGLADRRLCEELGVSAGSLSCSSGNPETDARYRLIATASLAVYLSR